MKTKHDYSVEVFVICATVMFLTGVSAGIWLVIEVALKELQ